MSRLALALVVQFALAAGPMDLVQARLARGDAQGAARALEGVARPPAERAADRAAWLDAHARVAWAAGRMDEAFARAVTAQAWAERAGVTLPPLDAAIGGARAWIDPGSALPPLALPTGDSGEGAAALARELVEEAGALGTQGAWLASAAHLLDASVAAIPPSPPRAAKETPAEATARRRAGLLQAACLARSGEAAEAKVALRAATREGEPMRGFALWFEGEGLLREGARRDARTAALRLAQAAAEFDASPWLRVAALRRAASALEPIDAPEAARLRAAADKETP